MLHIFIKFLEKLNNIQYVQYIYDLKIVFAVILCLIRCIF